MEYFHSVWAEYKYVKGVNIGDVDNDKCEVQMNPIHIYDNN